MSWSIDFIKKDPCKCCGYLPDPVEVAHFAYGWYPKVYVYPDFGVHSVSDWIDKLDNNHVFEDDYGKLYTPDDFLALLGSAKHFSDRPTNVDHLKYEFGVGNMLRCKLGVEGCVSHADGPWSYHERYY